MKIKCTNAYLCYIRNAHQRGWLENLNFPVMDITLVKQHVESAAHHLLTSAQKEEANTKLSIVIVRKYISTGALTEEEEHALKTELSDALKILGIAVPFVLIPGASIVMPIIIKVAEKHNINLLPSVM